MAASGARGITSLTLEDVAGGGDPYTVVLHFSEPDSVEPGRRVFDVRLEGKLVESHFDVARAAGGSNRAIRKTYRGIELGDSLRVELRAAGELPPVLSGVEILREEPAGGGRVAKNIALR